MSADDLERVEIASTDELRQWLTKNHTQRESIWLVRYKKCNGEKYVSWSDVVDQVLCFGWIDGVARKLDEERTMLLLSPRSPKSTWSKINKEKVRRLEKAGQMTDAGREKVSQAKASGTWVFLDDVEALIVPDDLMAAFAIHEKAAENFGSYPPSLQRGILEWIKRAKKSQTRNDRILKTASMAASNTKGTFPPR